MLRHFSNMKKILIINGPNINMLGLREPAIYGSQNYNDLIEKIKKEAQNLSVEVDFFQSNIEGEIVGAVQSTLGKYDGIIINPAAYTHTSVAIHDALASVPVPAVEVHISNIHKREEYRHTSLTVSACIGQICGLGFDSYTLALRKLCTL